MATSFLEQIAIGESGIRGTRIVQPAQVITRNGSNSGTQIRER
jgi:hypothetical protein